MERNLQIRLFGTIDVLVEGTPRPELQKPRAERLLAILALHHDRPLDRRSLADELWPKNEDDQAGAQNLNTLLSQIRKALGPRYARCLHSLNKRQIIFYTTGSDVDVDVARFDAAIERGDDSSLDLAISLYAEPLAGDLESDWVRQHRDLRRQHYHRAIEVRKQSETREIIYRRSLSSAYAQPSGRDSLSERPVPADDPLTSAIGWVLAELSEPERLMLQSLTVPEPGWTEDAAMAVCAHHKGISQDDVRAFIGSMLRRRLLLERRPVNRTAMDVEESDPRCFAWPGAIRVRLQTLGTEAERATIREALRRHYAAWLHDVRRKLFRGDGQRRMLWLFSAQKRNIAEATEWRMQECRTDASLGHEKLQMLADGARIWWFSGFPTEGLDLFRMLMVHLGKAAPTEVWIDALLHLGSLERGVGDTEASRRALRAGLGLTLDPAVGEKVDLYQAALYHYLGEVERDEGHLQGMDSAEDYFGRNRELVSSGDVPSLQASLQNTLGSIQCVNRDYEAATDSFRAAREVADGMGDPVRSAHSEHALGVLAVHRGDLDSARQHLQRSLQDHFTLGVRVEVPEVLDSFGQLECKKKEYAGAAGLFGVAEILRRSMGTRPRPLLPEDFHRDRSRILSSLSSSEFIRRWRQGEQFGELWLSHRLSALPADLDAFSRDFRMMIGSADIPDLSDDPWADV